jgi:peptidoglycan/LPS O-acetylase OafA/YrhL
MSAKMTLRAADGFSPVRRTCPICPFAPSYRRIMIRSIEGLRGAAALMVALFHVYVYGRWGGAPADWGVLQHAWLFVDLFFVVSGFVMAQAYGDRIDGGGPFAAFMARRFFRLYPLHIVTTLAVILAVIAVQSAKWLLLQRGLRMGGEAPFAVPFFDPAYFGLELLLLQGVGIMQREIHNYPSWSISVEFWMYGFFGLLVWWVRARALRVLISIAIIAACILHFVFLWRAGAPATLDVQGMPRGLLSFFIGVMVYEAWRVSRPWLVNMATNRGWLLGLLQVAALLAALWLVDRQAVLGTWQLAIPFAFATLVWLLLPDEGLVALALQTGPMQWLGLHSYAIYLVHITVQTVLDWPGRVVPEPWKHGVGLLFVALVCVLAALCYRFVEVPWRERGKRIARRIEDWSARRAGQGRAVLPARRI